MEELPIILNEFVIPHRAFSDALEQIRQAFRFAQHKSAPEGLAVIGESGTGKSSVLELVLSEHLPYRDVDGMKTPILYASVPPGPTRKSLASELLAATNDPDPDRGTVFELTRRLKKHIESSRTCMLLVDEFHHFYSQEKHKFMHEVADWLKMLINDTKTTLVVAGLPTCAGVIDQNEQLARRFHERLELPRFCWTNIDQRKQFLGILRCYEMEITKEFKIPSFTSESMAFRFYCATGGLMGYLSNLVKQMLKNAESNRERPIELKDIALAHQQATWKNKQFSDLSNNPFSDDFELAGSEELLKNVASIGTIVEEPTTSSHIRQRTPRRQSVNSMLRIH